MKHRHVQTASFPSRPMYMYVYDMQAHIKDCSAGNLMIFESDLIPLSFCVLCINMLWYTCVGMCEQCMGVCVSSLSLLLPPSFSTFLLSPLPISLFLSPLALSLCACVSVLPLPGFLSLLVYLSHFSFSLFSLSVLLWGEEMTARCANNKEAIAARPLCPTLGIGC